MSISGIPLRLNSPPTSSLGWTESSHKIARKCELVDVQCVRCSVQVTNQLVCHDFVAELTFQRADFSYLVEWQPLVVSMNKLASTLAGKLNVTM